RVTVDGSTIKAVAAVEGDRCNVVGEYHDTVTVEAGESGLPPGAPVQVQMVVRLDGVFTLAPGNGVAEATMSTWLCVDRIDCDTSRLCGDCYPPITLEHASSVLAQPGASGMTWSAEDAWRLREGEAETDMGIVSDHCNADCGDSVTLP